MHMAIQLQVLQNKTWVLSFDSGCQLQLLVSFFFVNFTLNYCYAQIAKNAN